MRDPNPDLDELAGEAGSIRDGIAGIAGGLEALLARLRIRVSHVTLRVELPPLPPAAHKPSPPAPAAGPGSASLGGRTLLPAAEVSPTRSLVVLRLAELRYAGGPRPGDADASQTPAGAVPGQAGPKPRSEPAAGAETAGKLYKGAEFAGLTVELYQDGNATQDEARAAAAAMQGRLSGSCIIDAAGDADMDGSAGGVDERVSATEGDVLSDNSALEDDLGYVVICSPDGVGCVASMTIPMELAAASRSHRGWPHAVIVPV